MTYEINESHDPNLKSWVESANDPNTDFPIQNLPFCSYKDRFGANHQELGVRIGDQVIEFNVLTSGQLFAKADFHLYYTSDVSRLTPERQAELRRILVNALRDDADSESKTEINVSLVSASECEFVSPFYIGDYTDFYCSIFHATNVGSMFRPDNPLLPNYKYVPIGYHGRASPMR